MKFRQASDIFRLLRWGVSFTLFVVVAITIAQIVMRYALNAPLIWSEELARFLIVWMTFLGAAVVCCEGRHLNVDVFFRAAPPALRTGLRVFNACVALGFLAVLGWSSVTLVKLEMMQEMSALPLKIGQLRLAATVGCALMVLAILARIFYRRSGHLRSASAEEDAM